MKTMETTYVDLRKNPPKINKGNISGGPKDVAAVMVGAIVDMMYPEKIYVIVSNSGHTVGSLVLRCDCSFVRYDSIIHGSCNGWIRACLVDDWSLQILICSFEVFVVCGCNTVAQFS